MAYATVEQLGAYLTALGVALPANAAGLLDRASDDVDELLIGAVYDVDDDELPTDEVVAEALLRATCAQAYYLSAAGDLAGTKAGLSSASMGGVSWSRATAAGGGTVSTKYAAAAVTILRVAGLTANVRRW